MTLKILATGEIKEMDFFPAALLIEQGKAVIAQNEDAPEAPKRPKRRPRKAD